MRSRLLLATLVLGLGLTKTSPGYADGSGTSAVHIPGGFLVGVGAGLVAVGADSYWTVRLVASPTTLSDRSAKLAIYWTAWQPALLYPVSFLAKFYGDDAESVQAAASWPMAISGAGLALAYPDHVLARDIGLAMVGAADALLLGHDLARLIEQKRVEPTYAWLETIAGALQLTYAASVSLSVDPSNRPLTLALAGVPLALVTHGVLSLLYPKAHDPHAASAPGDHVWFAAQSVPGGMITTATGRF
jgi:hypothetical protein